MIKINMKPGTVLIAFDPSNITGGDLALQLSVRANYILHIKEGGTLSCTKNRMGPDGTEFDYVYLDADGLSFTDEPDTGAPQHTLYLERTE